MTMSAILPPIVMVIATSLNFYKTSTLARESG
jgi:hypothetical protein